MAELITETEEGNLPQFRMGEVGSLGLKVRGGRIYEEPRTALRFPESMRTYQMMMRDPSVAASINIIKMFVRKVNWRFVAPKGRENDQHYIERVKFFESLKDDMEQDWSDFINSVMSMCTYGFSVNEKVYKKRNGNKGKYPSKFDDGLIGWAKLPIRNQTTLDKWYFDKDYRKVIGVRQNLRNISHIVGSRNSEDISLTRKLPRSKFLLFKYDDEVGNPEGKSPLINAYVPWRYKVQIEEFEAVGVSRDLVGMPMIGLPPEYLSDDADQEKKDFVKYCKTMINDLIANDRAGILFPRYIDPDSKQDLFNFSLVSRQGAKAYDTGEIIDRYSKQIMMAFMSDVLAMGQSKYGSFSLADSKTSLLAMSVGILLKQIQSVINRDLVKQTYDLNMWDDQEHVQIIFDDIETPDLEAIGKFVQQCVAVGAMEVDKPMSDKLREHLNLLPADDNKPVSEKLLPNTDSKSGEGMKTAGEGTAKKPSTTNPSTANKANK